MAFKAGDVVKLKSGGPDMTVSTVGATETICMWFAAKEALALRQPFPHEVLERATQASVVNDGGNF